MKRNNQVILPGLNPPFIPDVPHASRVLSGFQSVRYLGDLLKNQGLEAFAPNLWIAGIAGLENPERGNPGKPS